MKIVLPYYSGDAWLLEKNLDWFKELDDHIDADCILATSDEKPQERCVAKAKGLFKSVYLLRYPRATCDGKVMDKWPWCQNTAFACVAQFMSNLRYPNFRQTHRVKHLRYDEPWLWFETDCTALKPGWFQIMADEYKRGGKPFGGHWNHDTNIFNGVAIYPPNVARYSPKALTSALEVNPQRLQSPWDAACSPEVRPHLHVMNRVMQHLWSIDGDKCPTFPDISAMGQWLREGVCLFHRCKDGSLIDRLREKHENVSLQGQDQVFGKTPSAVAIPTVDIFIVTFARDVEFCHWCLKSIGKFVRNANRVVLLVPKRDQDKFRLIVQGYNNERGNGPRCVLKTFAEQAGKGMLHHEAMVCSADQFCEADYILHMDADCVFKEPVDVVQEYFHEGKPIMLKETFTTIGEVVGPWQDAVEKALGFRPEYETMRRHPAVHPRGLYAEVRKAVEASTKQPFLDYVLSCRNEFPQTFAEYPTLGAWALRYAPDLHHWIDVGKEPRPADKLYQFWSHGGLDHHPTEGPAKGTTPRAKIMEALA